MCMSEGTIVAGVALNFADLHHVAAIWVIKGAKSDCLTQKNSLDGLEKEEVQRLKLFKSCKIPSKIINSSQKVFATREEAFSPARDP